MGAGAADEGAADGARVGASAGGEVVAAALLLLSADEEDGRRELVLLSDTADELADEDGDASETAGVSADELPALAVGAALSEGTAGAPEELLGAALELELTAGELDPWGLLGRHLGGAAAAVETRATRMRGENFMARNERE